MKKLKSAFSLVAASVVVTGCMSVPVAENAAQLSVDFEWSDKSGCSSVSPKMMIGNVPSEAKVLKIKMSDLDKPTYSHGGGEVAYSGDGVVPEGALKSYAGPCPPGGSHRYEFVVRALNGEKNLVLGEGKKTRRFPE